MNSTEARMVHDGDRIPPEHILDALTNASFVYPDGARQTFTADGRTIYTENGTPTEGEWGVEEDSGRFWSFWPPNYRAVYDLKWIAAPDGRAAGVRFTDAFHCITSEGRYASQEGTGR